MFDVVTIKEVKVQLGVLCKQQRKLHQISQEELAEALGLSRYTIQKFESGKNATLDTVFKIAFHFDMLNNFYQHLLDVEQSYNVKSLY